jgi:crotonobetainyl-CoA:carnitine CoA-transferase CaiB-like acyl-CoA transferase
MLSQDLFSGMKVVSLEQALSLPYCTFRLSLRGMDILRVEPPRGDPNRYVGKKIDDEEGMRSYFLSINSNKKSVTLNLKTPRGREILHEIIRKLPADIFCTNLLPDTYPGLGIDYETVRGAREDIIWVSLSGFGPARSEAAYDPMVQAVAGIMDVTGEKEGDPVICGAPIADLEAANGAYTAIVEALYRREKTGEGSRIDVSMVQATLSLLATKIPLKSLGQDVSRYGNSQRFFAPVSTYPTKDGFVMIAVGNDRQWQEMVRFPGFGGLCRPEYEKNAGRIADVDNLNRKIREIMAGGTTEEILALFRRANIPASKVYTVEDTLSDEYMRAAMLETRDARTGTRVVLAPPPIDIEGLPREQRYPPRLGEQNAEIYGGLLGLELQQLRTEEII